MDESIDPQVLSGPLTREHAEVADLIADQHPRSVLDWGCGQGQITALLRDRGLPVTAYECDPGRRGRRATAAARRARASRRSSAPSPSACRSTTTRSTRCCPSACSSTSRTRRRASTNCIGSSSRAACSIASSCRTGGRTSSASRVPAGDRTGTASSPHDTIYTVKSARQPVRRSRLPGARRTAGEPPAADGLGEQRGRPADVVWQLNRGLGEIPLVNLAATNVDVVARAR